MPIGCRLGSPCVNAFRVYPRSCNRGDGNGPAANRLRDRPGPPARACVNDAVAGSLPPGLCSPASPSEEGASMRSRSSAAARPTFVRDPLSAVRLSTAFCRARSVPDAVSRPSESDARCHVPLSPVPIRLDRFSTRAMSDTCGSTPSNIYPAARLFNKPRRLSQTGSPAVLRRRPVASSLRWEAQNPA